MFDISRMTPERWTQTSIVRTDGKREFREKPEFGNRHVIFDVGSDWGQVHVDEYNALDFPIGTVNHLSKYTEEKTGLPEMITKGAIAFGVLFIAIKALQSLDDNID